MKHMSRILALLMVLVMVLTLVCACKQDMPNAPDNPDSGKDTPGNNTDSDNDDPAGPTEPVDAAGVLATFEKHDYNHYEFLIAASSSYNNVFVIDQFPTDDDMNGNTVHDALFERDRAIEEYFSIDLVYDDMLDGMIPTETSNSIRSGDDTYSLLLGSLNNAAVTMFNNDLLYDLNTIENIDLTQPYWNKNSVEAFTLNGKIFMATGAITNRYVYAPYALLFNTRLVESSGLANPYDLIASDDWTFENFQYLIMGTAHELNGNDTMDIEDFYGLAPADDSQTAWYFAAGGKLVEATDGGKFRSVYEEDDNYKLLNEVLEFCLSDDVMKYQSTYDSNTAFKEGRAIFHATALCDITMLSGMDDKYGIVPLPKYDAEQEDYYSNTNKFINTMALIPSSVRDTAMVGMITEALAAVSQVTSLDKQYETVLLNRQALDAESKANLKLVVESSAYDWGYVLDPAGLATTIKSAMKGQTTSELGPTFASIRSQVDKVLEEIAEKYE